MRIRRSARAAASAVAAGALVALVLVACSADGPTYAVGAQGLKNAKIPSVVQQHGDGAVPDIMTCDTSACTKSWSKDIFPNMKSTAPGQCAAGSPCHGATQKPVMSDDDPSTTYNNLVAYSIMGSGHRYVQPCADPSESDMLCNLGMPSTCGSPMPINGAMPFSSTQIADLTAWLKCGAPNN